MVALTLVGGTHVIIPKFDPELAMATIAAEKANYCLFVPTMLNMMLNHAAFGQYAGGGHRTTAAHGNKEGYNRI